MIIINFRILPHGIIDPFNELNGHASDDHTLGLWNSLQLVYIRDSDPEKKIHEYQSHHDNKYEEKRFRNKSCFFVFDERVLFPPNTSTIGRLYVVTRCCH